LLYNNTYPTQSRPTGPGGVNRGVAEAQGSWICPAGTAQTGVLMICEPLKMRRCARWCWAIEAELMPSTRNLAYLDH
jgi:hypothetical protein